MFKDVFQDGKRKSGVIACSGVSTSRFTPEAVARYK
jgi:hypothetical protein